MSLHRGRLVAVAILLAAPTLSSAETPRFGPVVAAPARQIDVSPEGLLNARLNKLEGRIKQLEAMNSTLRSQVAGLEQRVGDDEVQLHHKLGVPSNCEQAGWARGDAMGLVSMQDHLFFSVRACHTGQ
jgi:hypothetical protein